METLKDNIIALFGNEARKDDSQYPKPPAPPFSKGGDGGIMAYHIPREHFAEIAKVMKTAGARLAAEWATDETPFGRGFGIYACYAKDSEYLIVKTYTHLEDPVFPSLTKKFIPAYRFERQMKSLMGVIPL